jgi:hypothetical protein
MRGGIQREKGVGAWGTGGFGDGESAVSDGVLDVGGHKNADGAVIMIINLHTKEGMGAATGDRHCSGDRHFTEV